MALSKEWKERYMREKKAAELRMEDIRKVFPDWIFEAPKQMPRNDYEAARRITDFKRVNMTAFKAASTPKYVVTKHGKFEMVVGGAGKQKKTVELTKAKITRKQEEDIKKAYDKEKKVASELGLNEYEGSGKLPKFSTSARANQYVLNRSSKSKIRAILTKKADTFKNNLIKSLQSQKSTFLDYGLEDMYNVCVAIIQTLNSMDSISVSNSLVPLMNTNMILKVEAFSSDSDELSESNLSKVADSLGINIRDIINESQEGSE